MGYKTLVYPVKQPNHKAVKSFANFTGETYLQELSNKEEKD